ncbi:MAG: hypothetical protein AAFU77_02855 [Myxococcota bacterium]
MSTDFRRRSVDDMTDDALADLFVDTLQTPPSVNTPRRLRGSVLIGLMLLGALAFGTLIDSGGVGTEELELALSHYERVEGDVSEWLHQEDMSEEVEEWLNREDSLEPFETEEL